MAYGVVMCSGLLISHLNSSSPPSHPDNPPRIPPPAPAFPPDHRHRHRHPHPHPPPYRWRPPASPRVQSPDSRGRRRRAGRSRACCGGRAAGCIRCGRPRRTSSSCSRIAPDPRAGFRQGAGRGGRRVRAVCFGLVVFGVV